MAQNAPAANSQLVVNLLQPGAGVDPALAQSLIADGAERAGREQNAVWQPVEDRRREILSQVKAVMR